MRFLFCRISALLQQRADADSPVLIIGGDGTFVSLRNAAGNRKPDAKAAARYSSTVPLLTAAILFKLSANSISRLRTFVGILTYTKFIDRMWQKNHPLR